MVELLHKAMKESSKDSPDAEDHTIKTAGIDHLIARLQVRKLCGSMLKLDNPPAIYLY